MAARIAQTSLELMGGGSGGLTPPGGLRFDSAPVGRTAPKSAEGLPNRVRVVHNGKLADPDRCSREFEKIHAGENNGGDLVVSGTRTDPAAL